MKSKKAESVETETKTVESKKSVKSEEIISHRKVCDATGTGLSHYILMDEPGK